MITKPAVTDLQTFRQNPRGSTQRRATSAGYEANRTEVLIKLSHALAGELIGMLRYRHHYFMARDIHAKTVSAEFFGHSHEELGQAQYAKGTALEDMITEVQLAERIAIERYRDMAQHLRHDDPTSRTMLKEISEVEEERTHDVADLRADLRADPRTDIGSDLRVGPPRKAQS